MKSPQFTQSDLRRHRPGRRGRLGVWDFTGQVITHAAHQFFLTHRSLYVLVLDGRADTPTKGKPVRTHGFHATAWYQVSEGLRKLLEGLRDEHNGPVAPGRYRR